ncbi:S8 family serine peptidase [Halogranum amylolyticum]|nr:S8 family serine peptidase [Halogranum amylolyticum]
MDFDSVVCDLTPRTQIGIVGGGYTGETDWRTPWAESIGIDSDKATDFIGDDWTTGTTHGTTVTDTIANMLADGSHHSNLFVPLQVYEPDYGLVKGSVMRKAIEYALVNDIAVLNISVETAEHERRCPGTVCEELCAYTTAGYLAVVAAGNDARETQVCHPATSHFSLTVGGYARQCTGGYHRHANSNYGQITYADESSNTVFCPWCYQAAGTDEFQPNVYACYRFSTDAGTSIGGTSFSAPIVAAAGAIRHEVRGVDPFDDKLVDFESMNEKQICDADASRHGDVLHVPSLI